jgi:hypothetical protein
MAKRSDSTSSDHGPVEDRSQTDETSGEEAIDAARDEVTPNDPDEGNHVTVGFTDEAYDGDMKPTGEIVDEAAVDQAARNAGLA